MRRALMLAASLAVALIALPSAAQGSCLPTAAEDLYAGSAAAVVGTVVERRDAIVVLDVRETLRGTAPARIEVRDEGYSTSVALQTTVGEELGLVLRTREGPAAFATNGCLRTTPAELRALAQRAELCRPGRRERARRLPERSLRARGPRVVLGCARLAGGRRVQLVGYRYSAARSRSSELCIDTVDLATATTTGCGGDRVVGALTVDGRTTFDDRPAVLTGAARAAVRRVQVTYRTRTSGARTVPGALVRVEDPAVLRALRLRRAFSRLFVEVPLSARRVVVEGYDARGRLLGRDAVPVHG